MQQIKTNSMFALLTAAAILTLSSCHHGDAPNVPPVTTPVDSTTIAIDTAHWTYFGVNSMTYAAPTLGKFEFLADGVKATAESYRLGAFLLTNYAYNLNNRTIKVAWKGRDGGSFCGYVFSFADTTGVIYNASTNDRHFEDVNLLSTRSVESGSVVIAENTWYYTTIVTGNGTYTLSTASGNYASAGGTVIENRTGNFTRSRGRLSLRAGDPFGGTGASVQIHELSIR
jgi:nuclear transport factor 2 (NTF2) superfamily protein